MRLNLAYKFIPPVLFFMLLTAGISYYFLTDNVSKSTSNLAATSSESLKTEQLEAKKSYTKALNNKINLLGRFISKKSVDPILSYNFDALEETVLEATEDPEIEYVAFSMPDSGVIAGKLPYEELENPSLPEHLKEERFEIADGSGKIGTVYLGVNYQPIYLAIEQSNKRIDAATSSVTTIRDTLQTNYNKSFLTIEFLKVIFISLMITLFFRLFINKPLTELGHASQQIAGGNYDYKIDSNRKDEIGDLQETFETMRLKVLAFTNNLQSMIDERTEQISVILNNVQSGFFLIDANLKIQPGFTKSCSTLLGSDELEGRKIGELLRLKGRVLDHYEVLLLQVFEEPDFSDLSIDQLPGRFQLNGLEISCQPSVVERGGQVMLLFTVEDLTALAQQEAENSRKSTLINILKKLEAFRAFLHLTSHELQRAKSLNDREKQSNEVKMILHTIKGNAGSFMLSDLSTLVHSIEEKDSWDIGDFVTIEDFIREFLASNEEILNIQFDKLGENQAPLKLDVSLIDDLRNTLSRKSDSIEKIISSINTWIDEVTEVAFKSHLMVMEDYVLRISKQLEKKCTVEFSGLDVKGNPHFVKEISQVLTHAVRNSLTHGLESPAQRGSKDTEGKIFVSVKNSEDALRISFGDDGRGLDRSKILKKAISTSLITAEQGDNISDRDAFLLIFESGFSTTERTNEISGRGIGMSAILATTQKYDGVIDVENKVGKGVIFHLDFQKSKISAILGRSTQKHLLKKTS